MKTISMLTLLLILIYSNCFSQVVVNEIMYAPLDASNEWFELYNGGNNPVNLQNWKWKDATTSVRTITTQSIILDSNSYVIICQDSVKLKNQFPFITVRAIQTAWSTLNNSGDNVIVIDPSNLRADSVSYMTAWGGNTGGFSLEKINSFGASNNSSNWGASVDPQQATPGKVNSITPKSFDLYLKSFNINPLFPSAGETIEMNFILKNSGLNTVNNFSLNIYKDVNYDSIPASSELINSNQYSLLNYGDSITYDFSIQNVDTGHRQFIAKIIYSEDEDTMNNVLIRNLYVSSITGSGSGLIINEIMYDPFTNQSEWIELYNASGQAINIKGWKYKEATTSVIISPVDLLLVPGDFLILAHDSTIYAVFDHLKFPASNQKVKFLSLLSLNNAGENITITDSMNNLIDEVFYDPDWNNPEFPDTKGISLERINPAFKSNDISNWSSCTDIKGGTPGFRNSILTIGINSNSTVTISPNPFSPDADGYEDFAIIKYKLNSAFSQMRIKVYDIKGRLVRELANNHVSGSEGSVIFNGLGDDNQKLRIGIYILLIEAVDGGGGSVDIIKVPVVLACKL